MDPKREINSVKKQIFRVHGSFEDGKRKSPLHVFVEVLGSPILLRYSVLKDKGYRWTRVILIRQVPDDCPCHILIGPIKVLFWTMIVIDELCVGRAEEFAPWPDVDFTIYFLRQ